MSEHVASVEFLIEMGSLVLRYQRGGRAIDLVSTWLVLSLKQKWQFGVFIPEGWDGDKVSEHVASVESLIEIGSSVLRYQRGGGRSSE